MKRKSEDTFIIGLASDHAGFTCKSYVANYLREHGYKVKDYGTHSEESVDYPDYARLLANAILDEEVQMGIAACGSGNGISMALNRHSYVRAALCWTPELAALARQHNDANVLTLPGRFLSFDQLDAIVEAFLHTDFEGGRHLIRVRKIG